MHKRTIALAAAALLFNGAGIAQAGSSQKRAAADRAASSSSDKRAEGTDKAAAQKP